MDFSAFKTTLYTAIAANVPGGTTVVWDDPNVTRPPLPYVRLHVTGVSRLGSFDDLRDVANDPNSFAVNGLRQVNVSVNVYGKEAWDVMSAIQTGFENPATEQTLSTGGMSLLKADAIIDLTAEVQTIFEVRTQMDVTLLVADYVLVQPGVISHVNASGTVQGDEAEAETITVST